MKSKLFLSLSFLTAVFSMNAQVKIMARRTSNKLMVLPSLNLAPLFNEGSFYANMARTPNALVPMTTSTVAASVLSKPARVLMSGKASAAIAGVGCAAVAGYNYMNSASEVQAPEADQNLAAKAARAIIAKERSNRVYAEEAFSEEMTDVVADQVRLNNDAKYLNRAQDMFSSMSGKLSRGFDSSLSFVKANPVPVAGAVTAAVALGVVAYMYRDSIFGKAKVEAPKAPDVVKPVGRVVNFRPATRG